MQTDPDMYHRPFSFPARPDQVRHNYHSLVNQLNYMHQRYRNYTVAGRHTNYCIATDYRIDNYLKSNYCISFSYHIVGYRITESSFDSSCRSYSCFSRPVGSEIGVERLTLFLSGGYTYQSSHLQVLSWLELVSFGGLEAFSQVHSALIELL